MNRTWVPSLANISYDSECCLHNAALESRKEESRLLAAPMKNEVIAKAEQTLGDAKTVMLSLRNLHEHGTLFSTYLEARKKIFVDQLHWHVAESDGMEFDQYDTPFARWVIVHDAGKIMGGVRMLPTTAKCGVYSYMLRDAQMGILADLPEHVLYFPAPVEHNVWEATRFFITEDVPAAKRLGVQAMLFKYMSKTAMENGGSHILGIVPAIWARWARRLGVTATPIGQPFTIDGTASQSVLFTARDFVV